jgi:hypothetical protein
MNNLPNRQCAICSLHFSFFLIFLCLQHQIEDFVITWVIVIPSFIFNLAVLRKKDNLLTGEGGGVGTKAFNISFNTLCFDRLWKYQLGGGG